MKKLLVLENVGTYGVKRTDDTKNIGATGAFSVALVPGNSATAYMARAFVIARNDSTGEFITAYSDEVLTINYTP